MKEIIESLIDDVLEIHPVGHHHLKRHQVYKVKTKKKTVIIKFYYKKNRFESELNALQLLKDQLPVPKVIDYGIHEEIEYLIMSFIEGQALDELNLTDEERAIVIEEAGRYLNIINSTPIDLPFGRLNKRSHHLDYHDYIKVEVDKIINHLKGFDHPEPEIIKKGIKVLLNNISIIDVTKCLCHLDYSGRNILVAFKEDKPYIIGVIDFEQTSVTDLAQELTLVHTNLLDEKTFDTFYKGYKRKVEIPDIYYLFYGLTICAWSLPVDRNFYNQGLDIIKAYIKGD